MTFTFTIIQPDGDMKTFTIYPDSIKECLEEVTPLLLCGRTLFFASFKAAKSPLVTLPVDTIEQETVPRYIKRLEKLWTECLK